MYPNDYGNFEVLSRIPGDGSNCEVVRLKYKDELVSCPHCQSKDYSGYDTRAPRKILDVYESGKTVRLEIENKRCQCRNCGKTFNSTIYPSGISEKARVSDDCLAEMADYAIQYPGMTNRDIAKVFGVSPTVVSQAIHDRIESTEIRFISTLEPTKLLFVYPFDYFGKKRYAICGTDVNDETVLYDIRPDYAPADIRHYFDIIRFKASKTDNGAPWATFTDFNQEIVGILLDAKCLRPSDDELPTLGIIRKLLEDKVKEYQTPKSDIVGKTINGDLNYLLIMLFDDDETTEDNFQEKLQEWFDMPSDEDEQRNADIKAHLEPLYLLLEDFEPLCALIFAYTPEEMAIDEHLDFIPAFRRHNTPFEEMRYRILLHAENQECVPMQRLLSSKYDGTGVRRMRVNLKTINAIYTKDWEPPDDSKKDDFQEFYKT